MRFQSNVLNKNKYEKWIILFLTLTFIIDIIAGFFFDGLEGATFIVYRLSGFIAFSLILINEVIKYKQSQKKMQLLSIPFFALILVAIVVSTIQILI